MDMFSYVSFLVCVLVSITKETLSQTDNTTNSVVACKLIPADLDIREELAIYANDAHTKLIKLKVDIEDTNITPGTLYSESVYLPRQWMIATSVTGKSILMLRDYYSPMSLFTLNLAKVDITLKQQPAKCLDNTPIADIAEFMRGRILDNFESKSSLPEAAEVCSQQVVTNEADTSKVVYVCCKKDLENGEAILCTENTETIWITVHFISTLIIQGFIVAFFPVLLPDIMFKPKSLFQKFLFQTEADKSLVMNVKRVDSAFNVNKRFVKTKQHVFTHMKRFRRYLEQMTPGKIYKMHANGIDMSVHDSKILQDGSVPVGIGHFIFDFFVRCAIRLEIPSVSACCNARMFTSIAPSINVRWYQCLRVFMIVICAAILASVWILRVLFYYIYEEDAVTHKHELYEKLGLHVPFNGFFVSYLSPLHPVFITAYVLLAIEVIVFYLPETEDVKRKLKFTVRRCFRDMHESCRMDAWADFVSNMLYPWAHFGIVGCLAFPLWVIVLPFFLILLFIKVIPIANLTVRFLLNGLYYTLKLVSPKKFNFVPKQESKAWKRWISNNLAAILVTDFQEENTRLNQLTHASSLIMTLSSIWCILFLAAECLSFFVECIVYALIAFILNPSIIYKYFFFILIACYGWDCATSVKDIYNIYGKAVNSKVQSIIGDRLQNVASQNAAFRIENEEEATEPLILVAGSNRYLKWRASRLVLFLDSSDIPFIPKSFLMRMGRLQHAICPGQVHVLYLRAFVDFALIVFFLVFVFIIIFAFGQARDISSAGQTIVALASGSLPKIIKIFSYKSQTGPSQDTSNMKFHNMFLDDVKHYNDRWNFEDIHITNIEEISTETPQPATDSGAHALSTIELDIENETTALAITLEQEHGDHDTSSTACITGGNAIELTAFSNEDARKIDVDLLVKPVLPQSEDGPDLEFYVPITRVADFEDDDVVNDNGVHLL